MINYNTVTVSEVNRYVKSILAAEDILYGMSINGEISNFVHHIKSGHFYFSLKDSQSSIKCVMFKNSTEKLSFIPGNGMNVTVRGDVQVFERDGIYQIYCADIYQNGVGELHQAFEKLKNKLKEKGLFDPEFKKPIPEYPANIGVITSKTGAALQDIINVLSRRYPCCKLTVFPAIVQGDKAPKSICDSIRLANRTKGIDVIILGRGGGSIEDLWAFNDENVAYEIFESKIPVVSAIGHEIDFTIADFVADLRAPTPSAAAELVTPDILNLMKAIDNYQNLMYNYTLNCINSRIDSVEAISDKLSAFSPKDSLDNSIKQLDISMKRLELSFNANYNLKVKNFFNAVNMLESLSPLNVLTRGFSITFDQNNKPIVSSKKLKSGQKIKTKFQDGEIFSLIIDDK